MKSSVPPIRIGLISWDLYNPKGGLGRALSDMVHAVDESGMQVVTAGPDEFPESTHTPLLSLTHRMGGHILFSLLLPFVMQKWIDRNAIRVLIIPTGPGGVFLLKKPVRCALISVSYHTYAQQARLVPGQQWKSLFRILEARTLRMSDRIHCYSEDTRRDLEQGYHLLNVRFLSQIFHADLWSPVQGAQKTEGLCMCIARLEKRKGVECLLRAWTDVQKRLPHARLIIVGDGILAKSIDRRISTMPSVRRIPFASQPKLISLVQTAEIVICPSYLEGFGLTALEAVMAGTLVVAHDTDGLKSMLPQKKGIVLVPVGDSARMTECIVHMLSDSTARSDIQRRAQDEALIRFHEGKAKKHLVRSISEIGSRLHASKHVSLVP